MRKKCQICVKFGTFFKKIAKNAKKKKKIDTFPVIKSSRGREKINLFLKLNFGG